MKRRSKLMQRTILAVFGRRAQLEQEALCEFRSSVFKRAGWRCERCNTDRMLEAHHRLPRSRGGTHEPENGAALCWRCHRLVTDHVAEDWREWIS